MDDDRKLAADFAVVYCAHLDAVLAFCFGRTRDAELAADLAAEVFASALVARDRYRPELGSVRQWLLGIAAHKAADAVRRGRVERRAQQQLGMVQIVWYEDDLERVERVARATAPELMNDLPGDQRRAVQARVLEERDYGEIARQSGASEQVIRKRVSRGLDTMRRRLTGGSS
jgi:RNA polymerase sigma-70 factor (ECF subfamily)